MTFTIEDIKRLIPEADVIETYPIEYLGSPPRYELLWDGLRINVSSHWIQALLTTRKQLEIAMETLEKVKKIDRDGDLEWVDSEYQPGDWMEKWADQLNQCGKAADEALESIKKVGEA